MSFKIGNFYVKDVVFGEKTEFKDGILYVNEDEAIKAANPEGKLVNAKLHIVHPGDSVRILPVKAVTEPRIRPDGKAVYPGVTGPIRQAGVGEVYALKGMSIVACGKYSSMGDSMIDMSGPGTEFCSFSRYINLVLYAERANEKDLELTLREESEFRIAAHLLSEYIGKTVAGMQPDDVEEYDWEAKTKLAKEKDLPKVAFAITIVSQLADGVNDLLYGIDCHNMATTFAHPNEFFDGMVTGIMTTGHALTTYDMQNYPILKRFYREHGETINFRGVIIIPADVSENIKTANKLHTAAIAEALELDGCIVCEYGGGSNIDVDECFNVCELSDRGIKTVALFPESAGKMMTDSRMDAVVSTSESYAVIELPAMEKVIGDDESLIRDYYYGAWASSDKYGPTLRTDGSLICNPYLITTGGNPSGWLKKLVKDF